MIEGWRSRKNACVVGSPRKAGGFPFLPSPLEHVSGYPLLGVTCNREQRLKIVETE